MRRFIPLVLIASIARAAADCPTVQFEPWLTFEDHNLSWDLKAIDLDGDGRLDFVVSESNYDFVSVFMNDGGTGFDELHHVSTGNQPYPLAFADVDGDGVLDVCTGGADQDLAILFARDGGFSAPTLIPGAAENAITGIVVSDFDGDGRFDSSAGSNFSNALTLLHGASPTSFTTWVSFDAGVPLGPAVRGDLNGDGLDDAVHTAYFRGIEVLLTRRGSTPTLTEYTSAIPSNLDAVLLADLDGDGRLDIAQGANGGISGYVQQTDGTFVPRALVTGLLGEQFGIASGDFDGDGRVDLVTADSQSVLSVFLNDQNGFVAGGTMGGLAGPLRVAAADFDGDGDDDLAVTMYLSSQVVVFRNVTPCAVKRDAGVTADGGEGEGVRWVRVGCGCSEADSALIALGILLAGRFGRRRGKSGHEAMGARSRDVRLCRRGAGRDASDDGSRSRRG